MWKTVLSLLVVSVILLAASAARADSIYGSCVYKDGSKANGTVTVSTSWNSKKAYPANGRYYLDFGGTVNHNVTIYVNGTTFARIYVSGQTKVDIVVP
jgi:hypothetical protein